MSPSILSLALRSLCLGLPTLAQPSRAHPAAAAAAAVQETKLGPEPPAVAKVTLSLVPRDETLLGETLYQIADPLHPRHGRHLSREQALDLLRPHPDTLSSVKRWLYSAGILDRHMELEGQLLHLRVPRATAASLFSKTAGAASTAAASAHHAEDPVGYDGIRRYIRAVHVRETGDNDAKLSFERQAQDSTLHPDNRTVNGSYSCEEKLTPACIRNLYQFNDVPLTPKKTVMAVVGFSQQTAQHSQLDKFLAEFDPENSHANFSDVSINGGENPQGDEFPGGEANLDIQYAVALAAANVDVRFYSVGGKNYDIIPDLDLPQNGSKYTEPYLELALSLVSLPDADLPSVLSISYGVNEQLLPHAYARHVCDLFGQLAVRGVSVVASSGDNGPGRSCLANDGSNRTRFLPEFPASCPYVTAVGATVVAFAAADGERGDETAAALSGGGFSEYFSRPAFQQRRRRPGAGASAGGSLSRYVTEQAERWPGLFNEEGRGYPDVALVGDNYHIYNHDEVEVTGGTSASTPVFGAMIAVLNSLCAEKGKPRLGFLNPWLYRHARVGFNDITKGTSRGCPGTSRTGSPSPHVPDAGWPAGEGWDAATGIGSPIFRELQSLACV